MDPLDEYMEQDEPSQLGDIEIDMKMESLSNIHFGKSELQKRVIAHNVRQFFINLLPICRICLETEDDSKGTSTLNPITDEIWEYLNLEERHFPKLICTKCERIVVDFMLLMNMTRESKRFINYVEKEMSNNKIENKLFKVGKKVLSVAPTAKVVKVKKMNNIVVKNVRPVVDVVKKESLARSKLIFSDEEIEISDTDSSTDQSIVEEDERIDEIKEEEIKENPEEYPEYMDVLVSDSNSLTPDINVKIEEDTRDSFGTLGYTTTEETDSASNLAQIYAEENVIDEFENVEYLSEPPQTFEIVNSKYKCKLCERVSSSKKCHQMHLAACHTKPHKCPIEGCTKAFGLPTQVRRHIIQIHSGKNASRKFYYETLGRRRHIAPVECFYCSMVFTERYKLNAHIKLIHQEPNLTCDICGKRFNDIKMKAHMKSHEKPFQCDICRKRFGDKFLLKKHIQEMHLGRKDYLCPDCGKRFGAAQKLRRHQLIHHVEDGTKKAGTLPDELRGYCKHCGIRFDDKTELIKHSKEHSLIYKCDVCCRRYATEFALKQHKETHKDIEHPFECPHCNGRYKSKIALIKHMSKIHIKRRWVCSICHKTLASNRALTAHEKQHQGIKEYQCFLCEKQFASTRRLKDHLIASHTDSRYECPECEQRFVCSRGITSHLKRDHPGIIDEQPDVSVYFVKDEPNHSSILKQYKDFLAEKNMVSKETESVLPDTTTSGIQIEVIDLGFLDKKVEIDDSLLQDTMLGC